MNISHTRSLLITSLLITNSYTAEHYVVVFDVTNTLMTVQEKGARSMETEVAAIPGITAAGFVHAISNFCFSKKSAIEAVEKDFRSLLLSFGHQAGAPEQMIRDHNNTVVPLILVDWLLGALSGSRLIALLNDRAPYSILKKIAATVFNSTIIARYTVPIPSGVQLLTNIAHQIPPDDIFIMGNWEKDAFTIATRKAELQSIFKHIPDRNRIISSMVHLIMPRNSKDLFALISKQAEVSYDHIIFISSIPSHLRAAQSIGIICVHSGTENAENAWKSIAPYIAQ